jgi:hypothetical protein
MLYISHAFKHEHCDKKCEDYRMSIFDAAALGAPISTSARFGPQERNRR